jgi:hypothetical protein
MLISISVSCPHQGGRTLAWAGWKQPDIPVEVDMDRLETSHGSFKEIEPSWHSYAKPAKV